MTPTHELSTSNLGLCQVNPKGGAIALGHPLGATGARQIATLLPELKRQSKKHLGSGVEVVGRLSKCLRWRVLAEVWSHFDVLGQRHGCCLRDRAGVKRLNGAEEPNRGCFVPFWDIANSFWGTIGGAAGGPQALSGARFRALPRKGPTDSGGVRRAATASSSRACAMNRVARISGHVISSAREMPLGHLETGCSVTCLLRGPADRWLLCS